MQIHTYTTGDCIVILKINSRMITEKECSAELLRFLALFDTNESLRVLNPSVLIQYIDSTFKYGNDELTLLIGKDYCMENVCGLRFKIGIRSLFPLSTAIAQVYYRVLEEWCQSYIDLLNINAVGSAISQDNSIGNETDQKVLFLDLNCGIGFFTIKIVMKGTAGQILSDHVDKVIGIDSNASSITYAKHNMINNGLFNVSYVCSKVVDALPGILKIISPLYESAIVFIEAPSIF